MSFEEGKSIIDIEHRKKYNIQAKEIANIMAQVFYRQIFEFGFVHSDPHQGNLFIRKEMVNGKYITRLVLLDHGLYSELDEDFIYNYQFESLPSTKSIDVFMDDAEAGDTYLLRFQDFGKLGGLNFKHPLYDVHEGYKRFSPVSDGICIKTLWPFRWEAICLFSDIDTDPSSRVPT